MNIPINVEAFETLCHCFVDNDCKSGDGMKECMSTAILQIHEMVQKTAEPVKTEL